MWAVSILIQHALHDLKQRTLRLGGLVEQALEKSIEALRHRDADLAASVLQGDEEIDRLEVELEEECLKLLALHQPVAVDLRFVVAIIKLTNDLERIGDLASDIAERAAALSGQPPMPLAPPLADMPDLVRGLLRQGLDALVNLDAELAQKTCAEDDRVDELHRATFEHVMARMAESPEAIPRLVQQLSVSRYLERIADHVTNIAEDVIYLVEGRIVRHEVNERGSASRCEAEPERPA